MAVSKIKSSFPCDVQKVWKIVTDVNNYTWRSDLLKTEILNKNQFVEYTKAGYPTIFTITVEEMYKRWEFDIENGNIKGHWTGIFAQNGDETQIDFTEVVTAKRFFLTPFLKLYLKKQQNLFISDLKKALLQ